MPRFRLGRSPEEEDVSLDWLEDPVSMEKVYEEPSSRDFSEASPTTKSLSKVMEEHREATSNLKSTPSRMESTEMGAPTTASKRATDIRSRVSAIVNSPYGFESPVEASRESEHPEFTKAMQTPRRIATDNSLKKEEKVSELKDIKSMLGIKSKTKATKNVEPHLKEIEEHYKQKLGLKKGGKGFRFKKQRKIKGCGAVKIITRTNPYANEQYRNEIELPHEKLYIEKVPFENNNIISLRYKSNKNFHPNFRSQRVSQDCINVIKDILDNKCNERFLKLLSLTERETVKEFVR